MFDDDLPAKPVADFPRNLENMSVEEIQNYIADLKVEITRAENDIQSKQASMAAADSIFKS